MNNAGLIEQINILIWNLIAPAEQFDHSVSIKTTTLCTDIKSALNHFKLLLCSSKPMSCLINLCKLDVTGEVQTNSVVPYCSIRH